MPAQEESEEMEEDAADSEAAIISAATDVEISTAPGDGDPAMTSE